MYVMRRVNDPVDGEAVVIRLELPQDAPREFMMPLSLTVSNDKFATEMAKNGIALRGHQKVRELTVDWINDLQFRGTAEQAARRFGWIDGKTDEFVLGDRIITKQGTRPNYPTRSTALYFNKFTVKGTLEGWKQTLNYYNRPGFELYQYVVLRAFGSVLLKFVAGIHATGMHLHSQDTGYGKTTVLRAMMSAWGNPEELVPKAVDTQNSLMAQAAIHGDTPLPIDEFSNIQGHQGSQFILTVTDGQEKARLDKNAQLRWRPEKWNFLWTSTANESMNEIIAQYKKKGVAEQARLLDVRVDRIKSIKKADSDLFADALMKNYGHAGPIFVEYVIKNQDSVIKAIGKARKYYDNRFGMTGQDRFWSADIAVCMVALTICKGLGLIGYDEAPIERFVGEMLDLNKHGMKEVRRGGGEIIEEYLNTIRDKILVVSTAEGMPFKYNDKEPFREIAARFEVESGCVYLAIGPLKKWLAEGKVNWESLKEDLKQKNSAIETLCRLSAGSNIPTLSPTRCLKIRYR